MNYKIAMMGLATALFVSCTGNRSSDNRGESSHTATVSTVSAAMEDLFLFVGTYTSAEGSRGIYLYRFNSDSGISDSVSMAVVDNPSYLTLSPDEKMLYAVSENNEGESAVYAFSFDKERGTLTQINRQLTHGGGPCYITIDKKGRNIHTANYGGGSITSFQTESDGGLLPATSVITFNGSGPDSSRQASAHLHCVDYSPDGMFLFAADLGSDKLYRFHVRDTPFAGQPLIHESSKRAFSTPAGTGPRHFTFHPKGGRYLYVLGELSGEVIVYDHHQGELVQKQVITADSVGARGSADIHISPDGRFLYASNRLEADGIALFSIDPEEGTLTKVGYQLTGKHPRNFVITPNGRFLLAASRDDDKIEVFAIDSVTGLLSDMEQDILLSKPVCLKFASGS